MTLGAPVLYIGPEESHITDLGNCEWIFASRHGDVPGIARRILDARDAGPRRHTGARMQAQQFAQGPLVERLAAVITGGHGVSRFCAPGVVSAK
jgi:hypothetical protein